MFTYPYKLSNALVLQAFTERPVPIICILVPYNSLFVVGAHWPSETILRQTKIYLSSALRQPESLSLGE